MSKEYHQDIPYITIPLPREACLSISEFQLSIAGDHIKSLFAASRDARLPQFEKYFSDAEIQQIGNIIRGIANIDNYNQYKDALERLKNRYGKANIEECNILAIIGYDKNFESVYRNTVRLLYTARQLEQEGINNVEISVNGTSQVMDLGASFLGTAIMMSLNQLMDTESSGNSYTLRQKPAGQKHSSPFPTA